MITAIKVKACQAIDWLDARRDPFQEFTRPAEFRGTPAPKLSVLAQQYEEHLLSRFLILGGRIVNYRIPLDPTIPLDLGDQAIWHGIATAMMSFKYMVTKDPAAAKLVSDWVDGLVAQQPGGRLVRGINDWPDTIQDDASNDQATGHLAGLYFAWRCGPPEVASTARVAIMAWAAHIIAHGYALVGPDGKPTTYGALDRGWLTDPLRASLLIAIMVAAWKMTGMSAFADAYWKMMKLYGALLPYAKMRLWKFDTTYDTHRAALHLAIITDAYGGSEAHAGLQRIWRMQHKTGNAWVWGLCHLKKGVVEDADMIGLAECKKALSEFEFGDMTNSEHINSTDPTFIFDRMSWKGEPCSLQPMPRWRCVAQDFIWQRSLYAMDKHGPADSRYSGLGFLAAYWLLRTMGAVGPEE